MRFQNPPDFSTWRQIARQLLAHGIAPHEIQWRSADHQYRSHARTDGFRSRGNKRTCLP